MNYKEQKTDDITAVIIEMRIKGGMSRHSIVKILKEKYDYSGSGAYKAYNAASKEIGRLYTNLNKDVRKENILLLEEMFQRNIANGNDRLALSIIQEVNKCSDMYNNTLKLEVSEPIQINIK